jgi:hypothetical protein
MFLMFLTWFLSLSYRWSLKSTALIWSPLLWVVISARGSGVPRVDLSLIRDWPLYKVMRLYSLFVLALFAAKVWVFFNLDVMTALVAWLQQRWGLYVFIAPHVLPSWQLAAGANAAIAWVLLFFAQWQLMSIQHNSPSALSDIAVGFILGTASVIRNLLSFWVIFCTLWLAWQLEWPHFRVQYLPW